MPLAFENFKAKGFYSELDRILQKNRYRSRFLRTRLYFYYV
jgi:hypothetical protein